MIALSSSFSHHPRASSVIDASQAPTSSSQFLAPPFESPSPNQPTTGIHLHLLRTSSTPALSRLMAEDAQARGPSMSAIMLSIPQFPDPDPESRSSQGGSSNGTTSAGGEKRRKKLSKARPSPTDAGSGSGSGLSVNVRPSCFPSFLSLRLRLLRVDLNKTARHGTALPILSFHLLSRSIHSGVFWRRSLHYIRSREGGAAWLGWMGHLLTIVEHDRWMDMISYDVPILGIGEREPPRPVLHLRFVSS